MATPTYYGFSFPFLVPPDGVLPPQSDLRIIKNDLKQLLLTSPGERRMRPDFGTDIRKFPFEPFDDNVNALKRSIFSAIEKFEPRVVAKDIRVSGNSNTNTLTITVLAALTRNPNVELTVEFTIVNPTSSVPTQQVN